MPYFRQTIVLEPGRASAYAGLSLALGQTGDHAAALQIAQQAVTLLPGDTIANLSLGDAYLALGSFTEARHSFERVNQLYPGLMDGYERLGTLDRLAGNSAAAEVDFKQAAAIDQGKASPLKKLAELFN